MTSSARHAAGNTEGTWVSPRPDLPATCPKCDFEPRSSSEATDDFIRANDGLTLRELGALLKVSYQWASCLRHRALEGKLPPKQRKESNGGMIGVREVASLLNISPSAVRGWSNMGFLPAHRLGNRGHRRFKPDEVKAFLATSEEAVGIPLSIQQSSTALLRTQAFVRLADQVYKRLVEEGTPREDAQRVLPRIRLIAIEEGENGL